MAPVTRVHVVPLMVLVLLVKANLGFLNALVFIAPIG
jgi:hypothetical protein